MPLYESGGVRQSMRGVCGIVMKAAMKRLRHIWRDMLLTQSALTPGRKSLTALQILVRATVAVIG